MLTIPRALIGPQPAGRRQECLNIYLFAQRCGQSRRSIHSLLCLALLSSASCCAVHGALDRFLTSEPPLPARCLLTSVKQKPPRNRSMALLFLKQKLFPARDQKGKPHGEYNTRCRQQ